MTPSPPRPPALLLGASLIARLAGATLALVLVLGGLVWQDWRGQLAADLPATAELASQLLRDELAGRAGAFNRPQLTTTLQPLAPLARRAAFCAELHNLQGRLMDRGCLPREVPATQRGDLQAPRDFGLVLAGAEPAAPPWPWAARLTRWLAGPLTAAPAQTLVLPEGLKLGTLEVAPDWRHEAAELGRRWSALALGGMALLAGLLLIARAHTRQWQALQRQQRLLALQLLQGREQERRRLARELHDELGQSLAALHAEAAVVGLLATQPPNGAATLQRSAQAMRGLLGQMQDELQRVLADLRPQALDRFGLGAALQGLAAQPRRLADGHLMQVALVLPEGGARLPADHEVHAYRIAQEALTNAWRHGQARHATVRLTVGEGHWHLTVEDDGCGLTDPGTAPGHGLLGLRERVAALGGQWRWAAARPAGICLAVSVPWPDDEAKPAASGLPSAALEEAGP